MAGRTIGDDMSLLDVVCWMATMMVVAVISYRCGYANGRMRAARYRDALFDLFCDVPGAKEKAAEELDHWESEWRDVYGAGHLRDVKPTGTSPEKTKGS